MRKSARGLTLVEMMVAMVLGLVVIGGAISLTLANRQSYRTNEGLSQMQESARTAFELLSRDIRQAGVTGCDNEGRVANVLDASGGTQWWTQWFGLFGHDDDEDTSAVAFGDDRANRAEGTDAIQMQGIQGAALYIEDHDQLAGTITHYGDDPGLGAGDVMMVCDFDHATIFQVSAYNAGASQLSHQPSAGTPGNCSRGLGFPTDCTSVIGAIYEFPRNAHLARFFATDWYVGPNGEGSRSLFRRRVDANSTQVTEEIVAGVVDMQILYRMDEDDDFLPASDITDSGDWGAVNAVQFTLAVESADARVSADLDTNQGRLRRTYTQIITLRNRVP